MPLMKFGFCSMPVRLALLAIFVLPFTVVAQSRSSYEQQMAAWYKGRESFLRSASGWLNLAGLYWLIPGKNSFGSDRSNTLIFQHPQMPHTAGDFIFSGDTVYWKSAPGVQVRTHDTLINAGIIFAGQPSSSVMLTMGSLKWNIIKRDERMGVRLRDTASAQVKNFKGLQRFPLDQKWVIKARLEKNTEQGIPILNVLGQTNVISSPGKLVFTIEGKLYKLDALTEDDQLFIIFGDATSGKETYAAGRFLYAPMPDKNEETILDFNQSLNPPCAFSPFATCPLPPAQNILPFAIKAGEKNYSYSVVK